MQKLAEECVQIRKDLVQDVGPNARDKIWKPSGIGVFWKILVNEDHEPLENDLEPILVGVSGRGTCIHCGNMGPLYKLCENSNCNQVETKKEKGIGDDAR
jgi:hypothetical protein